jgi:hypothetical protein
MSLQVGRLFLDLAVTATLSILAARRLRHITWQPCAHLLDQPEFNRSVDLAALDPLWGELFPAEQARIVQLLIERVDVHSDSMNVRLRTAGLTKLVDELREQPDPVNVRRAA